MKYKKVKMDFRYAKDRFTRTLLVQEDINLVKLGCVFVRAIGAEFEHNFLFITKDKSYNPDCFMEVYVEPGRDVAMKYYTLKDLGKKFDFEYDTGDGWYFNCKVYEKETEIEGNEIAYLIDGKGQGVWEDNICTLYEYLDGKLDPESCEEDEEKGIYLPWNYEIEKYGDFDTAFDLETEKDNFSCLIESDIEQYLDNMHMAGYELEINADEEEDIEVNPRLHRLIMEVVDNQIKEDKTVRNKFKELKEKYGEEEAKNRIASVLVEEIYDVLKENKPSQDYDKKIKKLK